MSESYGIYTATAIESDDVSGEIDVRPPFTASEDFLGSCSDDLGTALEHFVTTPNTTRLKVTIKDEGVSYEERNIAFQVTAAFIAKTLNAVDQGKSIFELEPAEDYDRIEAEYRESHST